MLSDPLSSFFLKVKIAVRAPLSRLVVMMPEALL